MLNTKAKALIGLVVLGLICLSIIFKEYRKREIADISFAFVEDLATYTSDNGKTLPRNWNEFVLWSSDHTSRHWEANELETRFAIPWGMKISEVRQGPIITVVDPRLKYLEKGINISFDRRFQENN